MNTLIRLDVVLRQAVETAYNDLVTRPTGAAVRNHVIATLRNGVTGSAQLDFSQVRLMDFSCADEVVAKLLVALSGASSPRLILLGLHDNHVDAIECALERYDDLVMVAILSDDAMPRLLGRAADDWRLALRVLVELGRVPAAPVADRLAWPIERARIALCALAEKRCIAAHPDATFELGAVA